MTRTARTRTAMTEPAGTRDQHELAATAVERQQLYRLLAEIFREEPAAEFLDHLRGDEFQTLLAQSGFNLGEDFTTRPLTALKEELAEEFTRLFLGPGKHVSPHESVHLQHGSGALWGQETVLVKLFIKATGIDYAAEFGGIPDHVSVELEFLCKLVNSEADAWRKGDEATAANVLEWQRDFIDRHAGKWMPRFCAKIASEARLPFYKVFAALLNDFLASEKAEISTRLQHAFSQNPSRTTPAATVASAASP